MKHFFVGTLSIALLVLGGQAQGQTEKVEPSRKYCGSGFTENLVPDNLFGCEMTEACKIHDICYSKCDHGQPMENSDYCKKSEFSLIRIKAKLDCDNNLMSNIASANNNKPQCASLGAIYAAAAVIGGQGPFNGRKVNSIGMQAIVNATDSPKAAATLFSKLAKDSQLGKLDLSNIQIKSDKLVYKSLANQGIYKEIPVKKIDTVRTLEKVRQ